jgi:hypothetical protein
VPMVGPWLDYKVRRHGIVLVAMATSRLLIKITDLSHSYFILETRLEVWISYNPGQNWWLSVVLIG